MDTAEVVAEQLREAGINVTIQPVEWSTWLDTIYNGRQFQPRWWAWTPPI